MELDYVAVESADIQSFNIEQTIVSNNSIVGSCELGKAEIQLINDSNEYSVFKDKWIHTTQGSFYIYNIEPVQEKINIKLSCYDYKYVLDVPYNKELYENIFPCTILEWRNAIARILGITFGDDGIFPNHNFILPEHPYVGENVSYRNVVSQILQATASFLTVDSNDVFYFSWIDNTVTYSIHDWIELTTESLSSTPINEVVLGRGDVEDIVIYPDPAPSDPSEFRIDNNYILDPQNPDESDRRFDVIAPIYNRINGFSYLIYSMRIQDESELFNIGLGNKISYVDIWGNNLESIVMSRTLKYIGGDISNPLNWESSLSAVNLKETSSEYSYAEDLRNSIYKMGVWVDKENKKITSEISETGGRISSVEQTLEGIESTVRTVEDNVLSISEAGLNDKQLSELNSYLTELQANIKVLIDNITMSVKKSGGNNRIKNSVGFKGTDYWSLSDGAEVFTSQSTDIIQTTISGSEFILNRGSMRADFNTIVGGLYTLSFKFKKTAIGSTDRVAVRLHKSEEEYTTIYDSSEDVEEWREVVYQYVATTTTPYLVIESYGDRFEFTDLIINDGDQQTWTQYFDEVYGKTHQLDMSGLTLKDEIGREQSVLNNNNIVFTENNNINAELSKERVKSNSAEINSLFIEDFVFTAISHEDLIVY